MVQNWKYQKLDAILKAGSFQPILKYYKDSLNVMPGEAKNLRNQKKLFIIWKPNEDSFYMNQWSECVYLSVRV